MTWIWLALAILLLVAGIRATVRLRAVRRGSVGPTVDDAAVRSILETGSIESDDDDEPLDLDEAARAEDEFWSETWDEPEEFGR
jgi:hypothetical protein